MARRAHNPRGDEHLRALERGMVAGELTPAWHAAWERAGRPGRDPRLEPRAGDVFLTRRTHDPRFDEAYGDPRETIVVLEGHEATGAPPPPHALAPAHFWRREASATQTRHAKQIHGDAQWLVRVSTSGGEHGPAPRERWFHVTSLIHVLQGATVLRREPDTTMRTNPGDDRLRALERAAAQGDPAAVAALHAARQRIAPEHWPDRDPLRYPVAGDVVDVPYYGDSAKGGHVRRYEIVGHDRDRRGHDGVARKLLGFVAATGEIVPPGTRGAPHVRRTRMAATTPESRRANRWVDFVTLGTWRSQARGGRVVFRATTPHGPANHLMLPAKDPNACTAFDHCHRQRIPGGLTCGVHANMHRPRVVARCTCGRRGPDSGEFDPYCPLHGTLPPPRLNPPRGDDELRRLQRAAAHDPAAERAYHRALERRGRALDRGLMLPRLEAVAGWWTPNAEVLCFPCAGPPPGASAETLRAYAMNSTPIPEGRIPTGAAITTCDRCSRRCFLHNSKVAHEHELVKRLQHVLAGTDAKARMEQTGGMCSGLSVTWPQNDRGGFAFVVEDEERDRLFHMTTHPIAAEFWNGDATPLQAVSGDDATVTRAIIEAVRG